MLIKARYDGDGADELRVSCLLFTCAWRSKRVLVQEGDSLARAVHLNVHLPSLLSTTHNVHISTGTYIKAAMKTKKGVTELLLWAPNSNPSDISYLCHDSFNSDRINCIRSQHPLHSTTAHPTHVEQIACSLLSHTDVTYESYSSSQRGYGHAFVTLQSLSHQTWSACVKRKGWGCVKRREDCDGITEIVCEDVG